MGLLILLQSDDANVDISGAASGDGDCRKSSQFKLMTRSSRILKGVTCPGAGDSHEKDPPMKRSLSKLACDSRATHAMSLSSQSIFASVEESPIGQYGVIPSACMHFV